MFRREDKLIPVITVVFYYGEEPWDRSKTLFDMLDIEDLHPDIKGMVQNYKLNLVDIHAIEDTSTFKSALGQIIDLLKIRKDKNKLKEYVHSHEDFFSKTSEEIFVLIAEITNATWLTSQKEKYYNEEGRCFNMCTGMKDWLEEVKTEGKMEGKIEGRIEGKSEGLNPQ